MTESDCDYFRRVNGILGAVMSAIFGPIFVSGVLAVFFVTVVYAILSGLLSLAALVNVIHPIGYATESGYKTDIFPFLLKYGLCPSTGSKVSALGWALVWASMLASLPGPRYYKGLFACMRGRRPTNEGNT